MSRLRPAVLPRGAEPLPHAVVIGLDSATGLQTARILSRRGVPVIGVAADPRHPCCRTRACAEVLAADTSGPGLAEALLRRAERLDAPAVLFPCTDLSVLAVSRRRGELAPRYHIVLPDPSTVEMLVDKAAFHAFAEREGVPVPATRVLRSRADAQAAARELRFPCILKPSLKTPRWREHAGAKAFEAADAAELLALYGRSAAWADTLVVQEKVEGDATHHFTCNAYFAAGGEPVAAVVTRKLRQWPSTGGEGSLSEVCRDERVRDAAFRLFRRAGHRGLGYLEVKRDARSGEYLVIEPNVGRPTGRSASAEAAGVELLLAQYRDALGWPLPAPAPEALPAVKWLHLRRDLQAAAHHWRRGELTAGELLRSWRGPKVHALFSWSDPLPFWLDLAHAAAKPLTTRARARQALAAASPAAGT